MRALIVLCSVIALGVAAPGWSYSSVDYTSPAFLPAHGYIGARTYAAAPVVAAHTYAAAPVVAAHTYAAAPVVAAHTYAAAPVVAARTYAAAPVVAAHTYAAPAVAAAPVVAAAPAVAPVVATRTVAAAPVIAAAAPVVATRTVAAAPVVAAAPALVAAPAAVKSQWHAQDEIGQASYGHAEPGQTHSAVQDAHGNKVGSYSYLNPTDGLVHRTDYVADALGYRVTANDLPVGPAGPVVDTPEVAIAKAAHLAAVSRAKRGVVVAHTPASTAPLAAPIIAPAITTYAAGHLAAPAVLPYAAHSVLPYAAHAPVVAAVPALRDATLTTVVNTPGHALSYRVY